MATARSTRSPTRARRRCSPVHPSRRESRVVHVNYVRRISQDHTLRFISPLATKHAHTYRLRRHERRFRTSSTSLARFRNESSQLRPGKREMAIASELEFKVGDRFVEQRWQFVHPPTYMTWSRQGMAIHGCTTKACTKT